MEMIEPVDVIIYPRVSSPDQKLGWSPAKQIRRGKEFCESRNLTFRIEDGDLGLSAKTEKLSDRPTLQKIVKEYAPLKLFKYLFIVRWDRFARNNEVGGLVKRLLRQEGILVATPDRVFDLNNVQDDIDSDSQINDARAENLRKGKIIKEGVEEAKEQGYYAGGFRPYAIGKIKIPDPENPERLRSKYSINDEQARVYIRMVEWYEQGFSTDDIAIKLNAESIPSPKGADWRGETILGILRNEFYVGCLRNKQTGKIRNDKDIPALIERGRWERLQALINKKSRRGPDHKSQFSLLRGLCKCSRCGSSIAEKIETQIRKNGSVYRYRKYKCSDRKIDKDLAHRQVRCKLPIFEGKELDEIVWNRTVQEILTLDGLKAGLIKKYASDCDDVATRNKIANLKEEIKRLDIACNEMLSLVEDGLKSAEWYKQQSKRNLAIISEKKSLIEAYTDKLAFEGRLEKTILSFQEVSKRLKAGLHKYTPEDKRLLLLKCIDKIELSYGETSPKEGDSWRDLWNVEIHYSLNFNELLSLSKHMEQHIKFPVKENL